MGGESSSQQSVPQQSVPASNVGPEAFMNQFKDMMIEAIDVKLQQFKDDWVRENQVEMENENQEEGNEETRLSLIMPHTLTHLAGPITEKAN